MSKAYRLAFEPMKKANGNRFFMAHDPLSLNQKSLRVDVPSQQRNRLELMFLVAHGPLSLNQKSLRVDVPRFELGASTMPR